MFAGASVLAGTCGGRTDTLRLVVGTGTALALALALTRLRTGALGGRRCCAVAGLLLAVFAGAVTAAGTHCCWTDALGLVVGTGTAFAFALALALLGTRAQRRLGAVLAGAVAVAVADGRRTDTLGLVLGALAALALAGTLTLLWTGALDAGVAACGSCFRIAARHD